jgi:hypothetical protein
MQLVFVRNGIWREDLRFVRSRLAGRGVMRSDPELSEEESKDSQSFLRSIITKKSICSYQPHALPDTALENRENNRCTKRKMVTAG